MSPAGLVVADTSAWVQYFRATGSPAHHRMTALIETSGRLAVTDAVAMELLAGVRQGQETTLRRALRAVEWLGVDAPGDFESAARIYRRCRAVGVTPRGLLDCLVSAVAFRHGATVLAHDADLARIATVIGITLDEASLR